MARNAVHTRQQGLSSRPLRRRSVATLTSSETTSGGAREYISEGVYSMRDRRRTVRERYIDVAMMA